MFLVIFTVLVGLRRFDVGNDTINYCEYFETTSKLSWSEVGNVTEEFGFWYYIKFVSIFVDNSQAFLIITAILTNLMILPTYIRLCVDSSLTIVLFCSMSTFCMSFSGLRQMLAVGIGFLVYECTRKKKFLLYILLVCIAISIHTSAFMLFFMYPLYYARITRKWLFVLIPCLALISINSQSLFSALTDILSRYTKYEGIETSTGAYTMIFLMALFLVFSFVIPEDSELDTEVIGLRNFLIISFVIQMFAPLNNWAMRMNYYYIIFIPLLLPKIIAYRKKNMAQVAYFGRHIMVAFFFVYFFVFASKGGSLNIFPYHFFWEGFQ